MFHVTSDHMTVYGPVRHQKTYYMDLIWQYMDRSVTKKYYMDLRSFGPYNIFLVTDRSIYCHMTLSAMNYLLYNSIRLNNNIWE
jgi:hypothetical protein